MELTIKANEQSLDLTVKGDINFEDFMTILLSTMQGQLNSMFEDAAKEMSEEDVFALKAGVYDRLNYAFAQILDNILPPSDDFNEKLTAEAILKAENEIIQETYDELPPEVKHSQIEFPKQQIEIVEDEDA